jgi:hypothetical protein
MIKNPNYSNVFKIFNVCGAAYGAYSALSFDSATSHPENGNWAARKQHSGRSKGRPAKGRDSSRKDTVTGGTVSNETSITQWLLMMDSIEKQYGTK